jgi:putative hydrolase of the HAD superfamily
MKGIKAVLFDLGGVIIDVDYQKTIDAFTGLGVENASDLYNQFDQNKLFDAFETGEVSSDYFIDQLYALVHHSINKEQIIDAWNAMIGEFPIEKLDLIQKISSKVPCYMLSNTNEIHLKKAMNALKKTSYSDLELLFKECYFSHLIGKRKPEVDTFSWVLGQMEIEANQTLFIDDSPQHIEGAHRAGMQTIFYRNIQDIERIKELI